MTVELFDYQLQALDGLPKNVYLAWDTGTGKTLAAIEHAKRHNPDGNLVIIAPASKVREKGWERELNRVYASPPDHVVISYEMFTKRWRDLVDEDTTLIVDEAHYVQHPTTLRSKSVLRAIKFARQWIMLSATPLPNGWKSAATYAISTDLSRNKTDFWRRFVIEDRSRGFPLILGYREEDILGRWWSRISNPLKRTGDLKLPSRMIPVSVAMSATERLRYKTAIRERVLDDVLLDTPSKLFSTLRQLPLKSRITALKSILDGTDEHVVVFYNFNSEREAMLELLAKSFKSLEVYEQSGHQSKLPPREKWARLKPSVTLVQYQSGSTAIELTYATITVYFSPTTSFSNYDQSKGRTRRYGQEKTTLFYHIAVEDTVDMSIYKALKQKQDFSTALFKKAIDIT